MPPSSGLWELLPPLKHWSTTWYNIPEDNHQHTVCYEHLNSHQRRKRLWLRIIGATLNKTYFPTSQESKQDRSENLGVGGKIIFRKNGGWSGLGPYCLNEGLVTGTCEYSNAHFDSIKGGRGWGNLLTSRTTISFSRRVLLNGVSYQLNNVSMKLPAQSIENVCYFSF